MNNDLDKAEKKWHDPDNDPRYSDDDSVWEDGNEYSQGTYDAMVKADMEED